jgi:hypothetical protein
VSRNRRSLIGRSNDSDHLHDRKRSLRRFMDTSCVPTVSSWSESARGAPDTAGKRAYGRDAVLMIRTPPLPLRRSSRPPPAPRSRVDPRRRTARRWSRRRRG